MGTIWNLPAWANHLWYSSCKSFACLKNLSESWPKLQIWTYFEHFMGVRHIPVNGCHIPINGGHIPIIGCHIPIIGRHIPVKGFWHFLIHIASWTCSLNVGAEARPLVCNQAYAAAHTIRTIVVGHTLQYACVYFPWHKQTWCRGMGRAGRHLLAVSAKIEPAPV